MHRERRQAEEVPARLERMEFWRADLNPVGAEWVRGEFGLIHECIGAAAARPLAESKVLGPRRGFSFEFCVSAARGDR